MKPSEMLKEIKNVLGIELSEETPVEEVTLAQMKLENGTVLEAEAFEADNEVFIVTEDEKVALPVGNYTLEDGKILKVEQEGVIAEIASEESDESEEEMAEESAEELTEELAEEPKEEEMYATKEELSEIRSMVEEIREMMKDKMSEVKQEVSEETELEEQIKEELSKPASEPITHSPEAEERTKVLFAQKRAMSTRDRVLQRIANS